MSATGSPASLHRSRRLPVVAVVLIGGLVLTAFVATSRARPDADAGGTSSAGPTAPSQAGPAVTQATSTTVVATLQSALEAGDRGAFVGAWTPGGRAEAEELFANVERLGATVRLSITEMTDESVIATSVARVVARWRIPGAVPSPVSSRLDIALDAETAAVASIAPVAGDRIPIWYGDDRHLASFRGQTAVAPTSAAAASLVRDLAPAVRRVHALLGGGPVLVVSPSDRADFDGLLAAAPGEYDGIAAVTTTLDGSGEATASSAVVLNPEVWPRLHRDGRIVVLAHEATHVVTGAATTDLPLWLAEGFADHVAVLAAGLPVRTAIRRAVSTARRQGLPAALPTEASFEQQGRRLEIAYEQSLVAIFALADRYGDQRLIRFYRGVAARPDSLPRQLREQLGLSVAGLVRLYRSELAERLGG